MTVVALAAREADATPLVVDLDGTLLRGDLLHESALRLLAGRPWAWLRWPGWLGRGKAHLKRRIAESVDLDTATMPVHDELVEWLDAERRNGRRIVLCSASDEKYVRQLAERLGPFDTVIASDGTTNVSAEQKARELESRFGRGGFDYVGNSRDDLPVWRAARRGAVVGGAAIRAEARRAVEIEREFAVRRGGFGAWLRAVRPHQWAKNLLVFVPLFAAHRVLDPTLVAATALAFVAFGLCASSVYLVNDLIDLESDRSHPRKRSRPFASGALSAAHGVAASAVLAAAAFVLGALVGAAFVGWLATYFALTTWYTFVLKRKILVDALALAALYTLRILAGGAAIGVGAGFWLLALSLFLFLSLAFVKRYSELRAIHAEGRPRTPGRDYETTDLPLVEAFGVASGFAAVVVLALYMNGDTIARYYPQQEVVWLTVPILLYWVTRIWVKAHRGELHDDPVVFAMTDRLSLFSIGLFVAVLVVASVSW